MHALNCLSNVSNSHTIFCRQLAYLFHHLFYSLCLWRHIQPLIYLSRSSVIPQVHCSSHCPLNHLVHRLIPISRDTFKMYLKFIHCQLYTPRCQHPLIYRHLTHLSISLILPLAPTSSYSYITPLHQSRSSPFRSVFSSFLASLISSFTLCTSSSNCSTILVLLSLNILLAFSMLTLSLFFLLLSIIPPIVHGLSTPFLFKLHTSSAVFASGSATSLHPHSCSPPISALISSDTKPSFSHPAIPPTSP